MALRGIRVVEIAGLAPAPFCGMILSDFGATVTRIDRPPSVPSSDVLARGKRSLAMDLKHAQAVPTLLELLDKCDVLIEPFRPGVMEKLGLGPSVVCARNPGIVYARLTGFGQTGGSAAMAGHDINYIALSGALSTLGRKEENPMFPINLLADFAGGGMLCAMGVTMALLERTRSGKGQVIDSAMVDGAAYLSSFIFNLSKSGLWGPRGTNMLDGAAPFYDTYLTKDHKYMAVGAIEPKFYAELIEKLGLPADMNDTQLNEETWPDIRKLFSTIFAQKTRAEWETIFAGSDACTTPILEMNEVATNSYIGSRGVMSPNGNVQPAPRLSRTPGGNADAPMPNVGQHTTLVLREMGYTDAKVKDLVDSGCVFQAETTGHSRL